MLTEFERNCVSDLLKTLELGDLIELAKTCTSGVIQTSEIDDSIRAILLHTSEVKTLLMRKKITKSVIFKYLHDRNVPFPGDAEKFKLVELVIDFWNKSSSVVQNENNIGEALSTNSIDYNLSRMAVKFAEWFYKRMNATVLRSFNTIDIDNLEELKEEDFWCDAKVFIRLAQGTGVVATFVSEGSTECLTLLKNICIEHSIFFSPNLDENGTKGISEPHGLVLITSCGTLHAASGHQCVGLYEQVFGLIKDPLSESNWKIKGSKLILRSQEVTAIPSLPQSNQLSLSDI